MKETIYKQLLLSILLTVLAFNYVDRLALGLVLQNIKADLHLSDTQLGLLSGIAFALFYSLMGIPIARWADHGNRARIIAITTALWSVAVTLCGLAGSFLQLLLIRIGVAIGEAGCVPPAHSLIADHFSRAERPKAVSIYMLGGPLSVVLGYFIAGRLNVLYGWRLTFVLLGLPGLALAVLAWVGIREPRSAKMTAQRNASSLNTTNRDAAALVATRPSLREVCASLWASATFRHLLACFSVVCFFGDGILQWQPAFFIRSYGFDTGTLGVWFAVIYGLGGLVGTYAGGELASRRAANNERLQLEAIAIAYGLVGILSTFIYIASHSYLAFGFAGLGAIVGTASYGPLFATIQTLVPERMRAMSIALIYLCANLIGMGLGPLAVGALSDFLQPFLGAESLRYALLAMCPGYFWATWHLWRASRTVSRDMQRMQRAEELSLPNRSALEFSCDASHQ